MIRDLIGTALIVVGVVKLYLAWLQVRSHRVKTGTWCRWPLSIEWLLAGAWSSVGILLIVLGWLLMLGSGPLVWWAVLVASNVAGWHLALAWGVWHLPAGEAAPAAEQDEP